MPSKTDEMNFKSARMHIRDAVNSSNTQQEARDKVRDIYMDKNPIPPNMDFRLRWFAIGCIAGKFPDYQVDSVYDNPII